MTTTPVFPLEGGCDCGQVRDRMETAPLFVHCCHCRWCQREGLLPAVRAGQAAGAERQP